MSEAYSQRLRDDARAVRKTWRGYGRYGRAGSASKAIAERFAGSEQLELT